MDSSVQTTAPIGILGGSFDPVHVGHLRLALELYELLNLSAVRMLPLNIPNHRERAGASANMRLAMLNLVVDGERLIADDREIRRGGVSYTIDSLESLRTEFSEQPLCLILGADSFQGLCGWHRWEELLGFSHIVVATRPGSDSIRDPRLHRLVESAQVTEPETLHDELSGRIYFQPIPLLPISSTDIRRRVANGRDISYFVASMVAQLIKQQQLYLSVN
ncbi:MAG TPA: nicotinic acid mononucleotide adenylyltransferase [Gammaproteobacteria bacterium]|nr:nicotinic acid mononucleotide adenylyltransferase [Gammaproteobacteria bacterium]|tara:strand:- start:46 stop:705 length:660 start_codon:yes stop_codon:yes gene_type:complete